MKLSQKQVRQILDAEILKRAEFEETFRGGVVVWCRPELAAESYLPVVFKGPSRPWEIGYGE